VTFRYLATASLMFAASPAIAAAETARAAASAESADAAAAAEGGADQGDPILVVGKADGYLATDSATATKTDTPLLDTPQTVAVVTREQIEDQALRGLGDVLRYVPGVTVNQGEGNRDQITLRGQNTTADFFLDGVRDDVQYFRPTYNIERVEVLKGPYALIFGRGGGGGIVNRVQKAPSAEALIFGAEGGINTFGAWHAALDVNAPLSATGALRVNAFYERLDNHRDFFEGERFGINPYLAVEFTPGWKAGLSYEYLNDDRVPDRGVPSLACAQPCTPGPLTGNRDTFFGVPGVNRTGLEAHLVKARLDGALASNLSWSTTVLYGDYDKYYTNVYANGPASGPAGTVALAAYTDPTTRENILAQSNLVADFALGGTSHKLLLGLEYGNQSSTNQRRNGVLSNPTLNLANIVYPTVTFPAINRNTVSDVTVLSVYAQDQVGFGEVVDLVVGLRYDRFEIDGIDLAAGNRAFARTDEVVSPRIGLIVKPRPEMSLYASYSRSFLPRAGDQFLSLTPSTQALAPEEFTNYELGAKWDLAPQLNLTAALFQLDRTNATTPDPANPAQTILVGETRTRGAELSLVGRLLPTWQVSAGYTYQDAKLRGNDTVRLANVPEHQLAVWNRFDVTPALGLGLGVVHQSGQFAAIRTGPATTRLPAFTRLDAALFYTVSENLELQLNVENALDEEYFSDAHNNNNITPGAPLNARLTARVRF
jgi:catecholate siderophore receptor